MNRRSESSARAPGLQLLPAPREREIGRFGISKIVEWLAETAEVDGGAVEEGVAEATAQQSQCREAA